MSHISRGDVETPRTHDPLPYISHISLSPNKKPANP
jgi:hypothetical protein